MKRSSHSGTIIDPASIFHLLEALEPNKDPVLVREILAKALELKGLTVEDVGALISVEDSDLLEELFHVARSVKESIYGPRIVLFAPLYISNLCSNDCLYCGFRANNREVRRRALSQDEIASEVKILVEQGHKRILLVAGESYPEEGFSYILRAIDTAYRTQSGKGEIRRVNVNLAPLSVEEFRELKAAGIGTYQVFQETYNPETYSIVHPSGPKRDYAWRIGAFDRAMPAGIDDVGMGVLFGLYDWKFEIMALLRHVEHLEASFGVGPHTISVPRLEPTIGSQIASNPPSPVSDGDFLKLIAILRMAVPYTGMIMSTREDPEMRRSTLSLGISQISAGSRTNPGGYAGATQDDQSAQFHLGDNRSLDEVVRDLADLGYIPSFCTACYRLGRTGRDFMAVAKPGAIKFRCDPNAMSTFLEYLIDYASPETRISGEGLLAGQLERMGRRDREKASRMLERVSSGVRDVYV